MHQIEFDKPVYSDAGLNNVTDGPFPVSSTTKLPNVYFSAAEYVGTGRNSNGDTLWTVRFTYPSDVIVSNGVECVTASSGAIFDEQV